MTERKRIKRIPKRIAEARREKGWTQSELARKSQISASAINHYEHARRVPETRCAMRLAAALGVSLDHILGV